MLEAIAADVDFLKENPSPGRALTAQEEQGLRDAASRSRCRSLYPVVMLALNTGRRGALLACLGHARTDSSRRYFDISFADANHARRAAINLRA